MPNKQAEKGDEKSIIYVDEFRKGTEVNTGGIGLYEKQWNTGWQNIRSNYT